MRQNVWKVRFFFTQCCQKFVAAEGRPQGTPQNKMLLYHRQVAQDSLGWLPQGSIDVNLMDLMYQNHALGPGWVPGVLLLELTK